MQVGRDWHSVSEEDAANTASLQAAQGVPKQCKFNIYTNITRKWGSSPSESLTVPSAKFFLRYLQQSIDFHKCWARCVTCSHHTSLPCPFASQGSFLVPSWSPRWEPVWLLLPSTAWLCSGCCCLDSSLSSLHQVFPLRFCPKSSVCPVGSSLLGWDYQYVLGKTTLRLMSCLSINTRGVRATHIRTCEQILTSSCFCLFIAISMALLWRTSLPGCP